MSATTIAVTSLLALALAFAAVRKLSHRPDVVATYTRVGVPEERLNLLATILLVAVVGLIAGLFWVPIAIATAIGLIVYFAVAIAAHVRHNDTASAPTPVAIELMAIAVLVLQLAEV